MFEWSCILACSLSLCCVSTTPISVRWPHAASRERVPSALLQQPRRCVLVRPARPREPRPPSSSSHNLTKNQLHKRETLTLQHSPVDPYLTKLKPGCWFVLTSPPSRESTATRRGRAGADERDRGREKRDSETSETAGQQGASPNLPPRRERRARGGCPGAVLYAGAAAAGAAQRLRRVRRGPVQVLRKRQALARTRAARRQRVAEGTAGLVARRRRSERAARPRAAPKRALLLLRRRRRRRRRRLHG
jgi:hypothetical protein